MFRVEIETINYPGPDDLPLLADALRRVAGELEEAVEDGIEPTGWVVDNDGAKVGEYVYET